MTVLNKIEMKMLKILFDGETRSWDYILERVKSNYDNDVLEEYIIELDKYELVHTSLGRKVSISNKGKKAYHEQIESNKLLNKVKRWFFSKEIFGAIFVGLIVGIVVGFSLNSLFNTGDCSAFVK